MQTRKYLLLCAAVIAICALFAATEVRAQLTDCVAGVYAVHFNGKSPGSIPGTVLWQYSIKSSGPNLQKISEAVIVIPRPVTPFDIVPATTFNYCQERDSSTKINRGNCGGFPVPLLLGGSGGTRTFGIVTSERVTEGLVSVNIVSGQAGNDVCFTTNAGLNTGIVGPGAVGDPTLIFQTVRTFERTNSAGQRCVTTFTLTTTGDVIQVTKDCGTGPVDITNTGIPLANIVIDLGFGGGAQSGKQLGRFDDFLEIIAGTTSECAILYRGFYRNIC